MSLVDQQVNEILDAEGFADDERYGCTCDELYTKMAESPEGMPDPEEFGIGNIPVCGGCEAFREDTRAEIESYRLRRMTTLYFPRMQVIGE